MPPRRHARSATARAPRTRAARGPCAPPRRPRRRPPLSPTTCRCRCRPCSARVSSAGEPTGTGRLLDVLDDARDCALAGVALVELADEPEPQEPCERVAQEQRSTDD